MHNCAMRIKEHFDQVNDVVSAVKASTVENDQNSRFFEKKICSRGCVKANLKARSGDQDQPRSKTQKQDLSQVTSRSLEITLK